MVNERNYFLKPKAENDIENIYIYGLNNFGLKQAKSYTLKISDMFQSIAEYPELGKDYSFVFTGLRAKNVCSHIIFYRIVDDKIIISRILHKNMDAFRHL